MFTKLSHHYLFDYLDISEQNALLAHSRQLNFSEGGLIFQKNSPARYFYFILEGAVRLYFSAPDGKEKTVRIFYKGMSFAEALMFMGRDSYPANAMALEKTQLLAIESAFYREMIEQSPKLAVSLLGRCCEHIQNLSQQIEMLSVFDSRSRFLQFLIHKLPNSADDGVVIPLGFSKKELAQYLALRPETLSRLFRQLEQERLIAWKTQNQVIIPDIKALLKEQ